MNIEILGQTYSWQEGQDAHAVMQFIIDKIPSAHLLTHLEVDHIPVYDECELYIEEEFDDIENVKAIIVPYRTATDEGLLSLADYFQRAIPHLGQVSAQLYGGQSETAWTDIMHLCEALQWMSDLTQSVEKLGVAYKQWDTYLVAIVDMQTQLNDLYGAMEAKDMSLLADLLQYELLPRLQTIATALQVIIDEEISRHDLD